jgi:DNA-binding Lrp family transcriptional regulator
MSLRTSQVSDFQQQILDALAEHGMMSSAELEQYVGSSSSAIGKRCHDLTVRGLLERRVDRITEIVLWQVPQQTDGVGWPD